jgi:hypothetical protein
MSCPKCKRNSLKKKVYVVIDTHAENYNLSKSGIRKKGVFIEAVHWDHEIMYCPFCLWRDEQTIVFQKK